MRAAVCGKDKNCQVGVTKPTINVLIKLENPSQPCRTRQALMSSKTFLRRVLGYSQQVRGATRLVESPSCGICGLCGLQYTTPYFRMWGLALQLLGPFKVCFAYFINQHPLIWLSVGLMPQSKFCRILDRMCPPSVSVDRVVLAPMTRRETHIRRYV